jgi:alkyldihydroxyacetonephosphate synthase
MTFRLPPLPEAEGLALHGQVWQAVQSIALECGGSISHHHGAGAFRNRWMRGELGAGLDVLQAIKDALDPGNLMNPGKLGLRPAEGAPGLSTPAEVAP